MISPGPEQLCDFPESLHKINYSKQYWVFLKDQYMYLWDFQWIIMGGWPVLVLCTDTVGILCEIA